LRTPNSHPPTATTCTWFPRGSLGVGRWVLGVVIALSSSACGKKGPPLAPFIPIPAAIDQISATRLGNDVYVTLTVPSVNVDKFAPADIDRVEIYGYTGRIPPPRNRWVEFGTLIATVPVAPPPSTEGSEEKPAPKPTIPAPRQGAQITIVDTLTPEELIQGKEPQNPNSEPGTSNQNVEPRNQATNADPGTGNQNVETATGNQNIEAGNRNAERPLRRFYTAFPFNPRGRPGPPGTSAELPLVPVPNPPGSVDISYTENAINVRWEPAGGVVGFLLERPLPEEPLPPELEEQVTGTEAVRSLAGSEPAATGPTVYNVYRAAPSDPFAPPEDTPREAEWNNQPPTPLNPAPVTTFEFTDTIVFNEERCYTIRSVRGTGPAARIGPASEPACVTPVDTFGPSAPQGVATVASEGAINLIWEPNTEPDLGGYIVLRGEAPGDTLHPLTAAPIADASYRDEDIISGVRYVYAVIAVDNRFPVPNLSQESERIEETAR
jgi:hypothetical protein